MKRFVLLFVIASLFYAGLLMGHGVPPTPHNPKRVRSLWIQDTTGNIADNFIMVFDAATDSLFWEAQAGGSGTADSIGIDLDGDGTPDSWLYSTGSRGIMTLSEGSNITFTLTGDTLEIAATGGGSDSALFLTEAVGSGTRTVFWDTDSLIFVVGTGGDTLFQIYPTTANDTTIFTREDVVNKFFYFAPQTIFGDVVEFTGTIELDGATDNSFAQVIDTDDPTADRLFNFPNDAMAAGDVLVGGTTNGMDYVALASGQLLVGQGVSIPIARTIGTDIALSAAGAMTINNDAVQESDLDITNAGSAADVLTQGAGDDFTWVTELDAANIPDHTGEVTGGTALTITDDVIDTTRLKTINLAVDEDIMTYEATGAGFEFHTPAELGLLTGNETITLSGDATGSGATAITVVVVDDLHDHVITNIDAFNSAAFTGQLSDEVGTGVVLVETAIVRTDGSNALTADWPAGAFDITGLKVIEADTIRSAAANTPIVLGLGDTLRSNANATMVLGSDALAFKLIFVDDWRWTSGTGDIAYDATDTYTDGDVLKVNSGVATWEADNSGGASDSALTLVEITGGADVVRWSNDTLLFYESGDTLLKLWIAGDGTGDTTVFDVEPQFTHFYFVPQIVMGDIVEFRNDLHFEGITVDAIEHILIFADPTVSDKTFTFPNDQIADLDFLVGTGAGTFGYVPLTGDATVANTGVVTVVDDLHAHTTTSLSGILNADIGGGAAIVYTKLLFSNNIDSADLGVNSVGESELDLGSGAQQVGIEDMISSNTWSTVYWNATVPVTLDLGASGDVLTSGGVAAAPTWETPSGGSGNTFKVGVADVFAIQDSVNFQDNGDINFVLNTGADVDEITASYVAGSIVNADVNASAAIVYTKLLFNNDIDSLDLGTNSVGEVELDLGSGSQQIGIEDMVTSNDWSIYYWGASGAIVQLDIGSSGQVLKSNGATSAPTWQADATGSGLWTDENATGLDTTSLIGTDSDSLIEIIDDDAGAVRLTFGTGQSALTIGASGGITTIGNELNLGGNDIVSVDSINVDNVIRMADFILNVNGTYATYTEGDAATDGQVLTWQDDNTFTWEDDASGGAPPANSVDTSELVTTNLANDEEIMTFEAGNSIEYHTPAELNLFSSGSTGDVTISGDASTIGAATLEFSMVDNTITLGGNPALAASEAWFATTGLLFEGTAADAIEGLLIAPTLTSTDKTWTLPDATGTIQITGVPIGEADIPTHTGDVTGGTALTIVDDIIDTTRLKTINLAVDEEILTYEATGTGFEFHSLSELGIAPLASPTFTGVVTIPDFLLTTGGDDAAYNPADVPADGDQLTWNTGGTTDWQPAGSVAEDAIDTLELATDNLAVDGDIMTFEAGNTIQFQTLAELGIAPLTSPIFLTNITLPVADNPTTGTDAMIAFDGNDNALEMSDGTVDFFIASKLKLFSMTIDNPDGLTNDTLIVIPVEAEAFPFGITLVDLGIKTWATTSYTVNFVEYSAPGNAGRTELIEAVATSSSSEAEDDGALNGASVPAGSLLMIELPATDIAQLQIWGTYYVNTGD